MVCAGATVRYLGECVHVVEIVNDHGTDVVVYRKWVRRKQRWQYYAEVRQLFEYVAAGESR